jgi:N6-L-threonylcarbamoyladenine synthase
MTYLGIDTSNYTTSAAILDAEGGMKQLKKKLPVAAGNIGLRQSDAVFEHVRQLGALLEQLAYPNGKDIRAVGVSVSPRDEAGSYMPCFLAGKLAAQAFAAALGARLHEFSHQAGHVAAALYDTGLDELYGRTFLALHFSGGTTQCLRVSPGSEGRIFDIETVAETLDLNAGQLVDRVGAALGLGFPAGPALETLAAGSKREYPVKLAFKGADCCLSGVENQCKALMTGGADPADIAMFCVRSIEAAASGMLERLLRNYPGLKVVCAGGVMSNAVIRESLSKKFGAAFASPEFSADNAAGIAALCQRTHDRERDR